MQIERARKAHNHSQLTIPSYCTHECFYCILHYGKYGVVSLNSFVHANMCQQVEGLNSGIRGKSLHYVSVIIVGLYGEHTPRRQAVELYKRCVKIPAKGVWFLSNSEQCVHFTINDYFQGVPVYCS